MLTDSDQLSALDQELETYHKLSHPVVTTVLLGILALLLGMPVGILFNNGWLMALAWLFFGAGVGWLMWENIGRKVIIYRQGVRFITSRSERQVRWKDIIAVQAVCCMTKSGRWRIQQIKLDLDDDQSLALGRFDRPLELLQTLRQNTSGSILKRYVMQAYAGRPITFGQDLALTCAGITQGETFVPWSEVAALQAGQLAPQNFYLSRPNGDTVMVVDTINLTNAHVFASVLNLYISKVVPITAPEPGQADGSTSATLSMGQIPKKMGQVLLGIWIGTITGGQLGFIASRAIPSFEFAILTGGLVGAIIGAIIGVPIIFERLLKQKMRGALMLGAIGMIVGAPFGLFMSLVATIFFSRTISAVLGALVVVAVGGVILFNQLDRLPGQVIFRVVIIATFGLFHGALAAVITGLLVKGPISYVVGVIVGLWFAIQIFKTPFDELLESLGN